MSGRSMARSVEGRGIGAGHDAARDQRDRRRHRPGRCRGAAANARRPTVPAPRRRCDSVVATIGVLHAPAPARSWRRACRWSGSARCRHRPPRSSRARPTAPAQDRLRGLRGHDDRLQLVRAQSADAARRWPAPAPIRISMIRPMPFWPSFEPCAKLTPVQVSTSSRADPERRRRRAFGRAIERRVA